MTDEPTPEDLRQLARSVAMSGVLGDRDRLAVVIALLRLADIDKATRRHPSARCSSQADSLRDIDRRTAPIAN